MRRAEQEQGHARQQPGNGEPWRQSPADGFALSKLFTKDAQSPTSDHGSHGQRDHAAYHRPAESRPAGIAHRAVHAFDQKEQRDHQRQRQPDIDDQLALSNLAQRRIDLPRKHVQRDGGKCDLNAQHEPRTHGVQCSDGGQLVEYDRSSDCRAIQLS